MKKIVYIIIALSLFGCNKSDNSKHILVDIQASGEIELVPDIASINVDISCTNKELSKSNECTKNGIDTLFHLLDEHGINKDDYHSSWIELEKEYIWRNDSQVFHGYKSSSTINVLFKDLEVMSELIAKVMAMKNASIYNLNYSHSEIESFGNKAYLKALDNSKTLANEIKDKLLGKSVEVSQISNFRENFDSRESVTVMRNKGLAEDRMEKPSTIQVNPGSLKLIKDIYVQYRISF